jgi:hypothetical protein
MGEQPVNDVPSPGAASTPAASQPAPTPTSTPQRRGPRLPLEFPVLISWQAEDGDQIRKNAKTISVCVNGALLALTETIAIGQSFVLTNAKTDEEIQCTVRSIQQKNGVSHVGIEFVTWSPEFWEVTFPREPGDPKPPAEPPDSAKAQRRSSKKISRQARAAEPASPSPGETTQAPEAAARQPKPRAYKKPAIALAAVVTLAAVAWVAIPRPTQPGHAVTSAVTTNTPRAVLPPEVAHAIASPAGFSLATAQDFVPEAVSWLQNRGQEASGQISGNYTGSGESNAFLLRGKDKSWRVLILADGQVRCDVRYQGIAIAARVPKEFIQSIQWVEPAPPESDGDGLLIVRSAEDSASGVVLFLRGTDVVGIRPADYRQVPLGHAS